MGGRGKGRQSTVRKKTSPIMRTSLEQSSESDDSSELSEEEEYIPSKKSGTKNNPSMLNSQHQKPALILSQDNQSQAQSSQPQEPLSDAEQNRLAAICANFFLVANCKKVPVKRGDLGKLIPKEYSRKFKEILQTTSAKLEEVFGYKVVDMEKKGCFLLINQLDMSSILDDDPVAYSTSPRNSAEIVLRTNLLISIFMCGGLLQEGTLREFLKKFGVDPESKENHPVLGNVQKLVYQDFVRQGYLDVKIIKDLEKPFREIRWGCRSKQELNKKELLEFVCKVYGDGFRPEMWVDQWREVTEEQEQMEN